jgi:hypothetical protein
MRATPARNSPLILTPRDEQMLKVLYDYRYMTAKDMAYLLFSPHTEAYVRRLLTRLSGGSTPQPHTYLYCFHLPKVGLGRPQKILALPGFRGVCANRPATDYNVPPMAHGSGWLPQTS